jgi:hypothetical protein
MKIVALAAALLVTAPLAAQTDGGHQIDPNQPANDGSVAASASVAPGQVAPGVDPGTSSANLDVRGNIAAQNAVNGANQAQYQADLASYDAQLASHGRAASRYARQRRAYADAMAAWRIQVDACQHGHQAACKAPAPDPANFY